MKDKEYLIIINEGKYVAFLGDLLMMLTQIALFYFAISFNNAWWTIVSILAFFLLFAVKIKLTSCKIIRCKDEQEAIEKLQNKLVDKHLRSF